MSADDKQDRDETKIERGLSGIRNAILFHAAVIAAIGVLLVIFD